MRRRALLGGGLRLVDSEAYVFEIDTRNTAVGTTGANQFQLHIGNNTSESEANYWVDFGDGTVKRISGKSDPDLMHTYANSGVYTIKVYKARRDSRYIVQANVGTAPEEFRNKLIKVMNYGFSEQENYNGCVNLTHIYALGQPLIYNNNFGNEYNNCHKLVHIQDIESWDVSSVTNMNRVFRNCYEFNSDLSSWDVSSVTGMFQTFNNCDSFTADLSSWDVSNVLNFGLFMWGQRTPSANITDFSQWNFNKNVNFGDFFVSFPAGARVFGKAQMDILLNKLELVVIGTGRTETDKVLNIYPSAYSNDGKSAADALMADGWTFPNTNYEP